MYDNKIEVRKQNLLEICHEKNQIFFKIQTNHQSMDYHIQLTALIGKDNSLILQLDFRTFNQNTLFQACIPSVIKEDSLDLLIRSFLSKDKIAIHIYDEANVLHSIKVIPIPISVREACKLFLGDFIYYFHHEGLKDSLTELAPGFLFPFSTKEYFLMICKIPDKVYEKIKYIKEDDILLNISFPNNCMYFSLSFQNQILAYLSIQEEDICGDIIHDFLYLTFHKEIQFTINSSSIKDDYYVKFTKKIDMETLIKIESFLKLDTYFQQE